MNSQMILLLVAACAAAPAASHACHNTVERRVDPRVQAMQRADSLLFGDDPAAAARAVAQDHPGVARYRAGSGSVEARAVRVMALALVRTGGEIAGLAAFPAATAARRRANVAWAVERLRQLLAARPASAAAQTDYAEALARQDATAAEGARQLEELAFHSVLASAHAWALVARSREQAGRVMERDTAVMRCRAMARTASVCALHPRVASR